LKPYRQKAAVSFLALPAILAFLVCFAFSAPAHAVTTIPYKMNFQGRLTDASGNPMAAGTYNMKFRIYDASSAGTLKWSEQRANSASTGVTVTTGGLFSVQLGDVSSLPANIFSTTDTASLFFEIELPTPATATCSTAACESYTEGPMAPRNKLASSAYSFNSDLLDGLDSSAFAQVGANNTWTGTNLFKLDNSAAFVVQNATGSNVLNVNTVNQTVSIGSSSDFNGKLYVYAGTRTNLLLKQAGSFNLADFQYTDGVTSTSVFTMSSSGAALYKNYTDSAAAFQLQNAAGSVLLNVDTSAGQVVIGNAGNTVTLSTTGLLLAGTARPDATITLAPEYAGATFTADGTNNNGSLSSDFCSGSSRLNINATVCAATETHNYYAWTTAQATAQDYDVYARYQLPSDYDTGSMTNLKLWGWGTSTSSDQVTIAMYVDSSGTACSTSSNAVSSNATWVQVTVASPLGSCTPVAGDRVTFKVYMQAGQNNYARAGEITLSYKRKN
jgi:hypothetical protein